VIRSVITIQVDSQTYLRQITPEDSQYLINLIDNNRMHLSQFGDKTSEKYPTFKSVYVRNSTQKLNELRFGIWRKNSMRENILVGFIKATFKLANEAEIGYWIGSEFQSRGIMTIAVKALIGFLHEARKLEIFTATAHRDNQKSIGVLEKSGFKFHCKIPDNNSQNFYVLLVTSNEP